MKTTTREQVLSMCNDMFANEEAIRDYAAGMGFWSARRAALTVVANHVRLYAR